MCLSNLQENHTPYQFNLPLDINLKTDVILNNDDLVRTVTDAVRDSGIIKYVSFRNRDAHGYDSMKMLTAVMLAWTIYGYASVRELEEYCRNDIRFIAVTGGMRPSFMAFERFIHDDLTGSIEEIFTQLNKYIEKKDGNIDTSILYIDGTKYEAYANKMTFVWMAGTRKRRTKLWRECMERLAADNKRMEQENINVCFSILREINVCYLQEICDTFEKLLKDRNIEIVHGSGHRKHWFQKEMDYFRDCAIRMWKYQIHFDIAGERNSFSKTDPDATFMHMKYDYYNHTNVFKPGYNVQMGTSDGYIREIYVSPDPNDQKTYIPFIDKYYRMYGEHPKKTPADAGYGGFDNYYYCKLHGIDLWMKYAGQEKKKEKVTDKNKFKSWAFETNEDGLPVCPAGYAFKVISVRTEHRGMYPRIQETLMNEHCEECPLRSKCTKSRKGRRLTRCRQLNEFQKEAEENMSTEEGKKLMINRDIWSEGTFGGLKEDWEYDRLHRRGKTNVNMELLLVCIGHNLRRLYVREHPKKKKEDQNQKA